MGEQTSENVLEAKSGFSETRSARNLSFDHGCRTENCVACSRLQDEMTNETVALKAKYKDVKAVGAFTPKALTEGERCLRVCCAVKKHWALASEHIGLEVK